MARKEGVLRRLKKRARHAILVLGGLGCRAAGGEHLLASSALREILRIEGERAPWRASSSALSGERVGCCALHASVPITLEDNAHLSGHIRDTRVVRRHMHQGTLTRRPQLSEVVERVCARLRTSLRALHTSLSLRVSVRVRALAI